MTIYGSRCRKTRLIKYGMTKEMEFRPARKVERLSDCLEDRPGEIAMAVKMRPSHTWTKRPRGALL